MYTYILRNKRNARNIELNYKFIFTVKNSKSIYVKYEYNKMFESMTKLHDHRTMTWL